LLRVVRLHHAFSQNQPPYHWEHENGKETMNNSSNSDKVPCAPPTGETILHYTLTHYQQLPIIVTLLSRLRVLPLIEKITWMVTLFHYKRLALARQ
jgi:hypothetical protein